MKKLLLFLTNNLPSSSHEKEFDIIFFSITALCWIIGFPWLLLQKDPWAFIITIFFIHFWDNLRHNRTY